MSIIISNIFLIYQESIYENIYSFLQRFSLISIFKVYVFYSLIFLHVCSLQIQKDFPSTFSLRREWYHVHEKTGALDNHVLRFASQCARAQCEEADGHKRENLETSLITRWLFSPSHASFLTCELQANFDPGTKRSY